MPASDSCFDKFKYNKVVEFINQQQAQAKQVQRDGMAHGGGMVKGRRFKKLKLT